MIANSVPKESIKGHVVIRCVWRVDHWYALGSLNGQMFIESHRGGLDRDAQVKLVTDWLAHERPSMTWEAVRS